MGYEVSFTRHFYKPQPLRPLEEIRADILALEREMQGLLGEIMGGEARRNEHGAFILVNGTLSNAVATDSGAALGKCGSGSDITARSSKLWA